MFSVHLKDSRSSHLLPSRNRRCPGFLGLGFRLLLRRAGSHSITYLCDNITAEKPSKQPCSQTKPAASTAKCSSGVIVLQLLVATIVHAHISFFSYSYVTCYTFTSVVILRWSIRTTGSSFSALSFEIKCNLGLPVCRKITVIITKKLLSRHSQCFQVKLCCSPEHSVVCVPAADSGGATGQRLSGRSC